MAKRHVAIAGGIAAIGAAAFYLTRRGSGSGEHPVAEVRAALDEVEGLDEAFGDELAAGQPAASVRKPNRIKTH